MEKYPLTDADIQHVLGGTKIHKYPELAGKPLESLFDAKGRCAILFLVKDASCGHWICMTRQAGHIEVFDSFGVAVDGERRWIDKRKLVDLHEVAPLLGNLLSGFERAGGRVVHNATKLQRDDKDTCGDHVCCRLLHRDMPLRAYVRYLKSQGGTPDDAVAREIGRLMGRC